MWAPCIGDNHSGGPNALIAQNVLNPHRDGASDVRHVGRRLSVDYLRRNYEAGSINKSSSAVVVRDLSPLRDDGDCDVTQPLVALGLFDNEVDVIKLDDDLGRQAEIQIAFIPDESFTYISLQVNEQEIVKAVFECLSFAKDSNFDRADFGRIRRYHVWIFRLAKDWLRFSAIHDGIPSSLHVARDVALPPRSCE
ncbi:unnamed protein product [Phytophthora fragariaefolia]|uniref:Unnamed protein product n=1 Tax=Phytophthora fragariaefolia TaxID=1490495 RepID=A0A9W7D1W4_9STRA|nr:unnamed protein product [Phytophthora fragariaefolia]